MTATIVVGHIEDIEFDGSIAIVVIQKANGLRRWLYCEPRLLADALELIWPAGDWLGKEIEAEVDSIGLMQSFQPVGAE